MLLTASVGGSVNEREGEPHREKERESDHALEAAANERERERESDLALEAVDESEDLVLLRLVQPRHLPARPSSQERESARKRARKVDR